MQERWGKIKEIFGTAIELEGEERWQYVARACDGDEELRRDVEGLLTADEEAEDFIETPIASLSNLDDRDALIGSTMGAYRIEERVGEGGMGVVYRAIRTLEDIEQQVAIKVVKRGMDTDQILRHFRAERRILARLDHPNIARLLDVGVTPAGSPFFVMEFLEGTPVDVYCYQHDATVRQRLQLFLTVCSAVEYAHRNLIVHRDLKPKNVLVNPDGVPKLLDFGIARLMDRDSTDDVATGSQARLLTPDFASPEQIRGQEIGTSSDIYSLGVLLFDLLTGRRPYDFPSLSPQEILRTFDLHLPHKPSAVVPHNRRRELSGDLDTIVLKAIEVQPDRRYATVQEFAEDVRRYLQGRPVLARGQTLRYRLQKFLHRNRVAVLASALVTGAFLSAGSVALWQAGLATAKKEEARQRVADLRELANTFLNEIDTKLAPLPGSTDARETLVKRTLQYLDNLAKADIRDVALQMELAGAYERLGDVQGGPKESNLGHTADAMDSYKKGMAMLERLAEWDVGDINVLRARARFYTKFGDVLAIAGDYEGARDYNLKALDLRMEWVNRTPGEREARRGVAASYQELGGHYESLGDWKNVLKCRRKALEILDELNSGGPSDRSLRLAWALANKRYGRALARQHEYELALSFLQRALLIEKTEVAKGPFHAPLQMNLSFTQYSLGNMFLEKGEYPQALVSMQESYDIRRALARSDPKDVRAASVLSTSILGIGRVYTRMGRYKDARSKIEESLAIREELAQRDPNNAGAKGEVAEASAALGDLFYATRQWEDARDNFARANSIYSELLQQKKLVAELKEEAARVNRLMHETDGKLNAHR